MSDSDVTVGKSRSTVLPGSSPFAAPLGRVLAYARQFLAKGDSAACKQIKHIKTQSLISSHQRNKEHVMLATRTVSIDDKGLEKGRVRTALSAEEPPPRDFTNSSGGRHRERRAFWRLPPELRHRGDLSEEKNKPRATGERFELSAKQRLVQDL